MHAPPGDTLVLVVPQKQPYIYSRRKADADMDAPTTPLRGSTGGPIPPINHTSLITLQKAAQKYADSLAPSEKNKANKRKKFSGKRFDLTESFKRTIPFTCENKQPWTVVQDFRDLLAVFCLVCGWYTLPFKFLCC